MHNHRLNFRIFRLPLKSFGNYIHSYASRAKLHSNWVLKDLSESGRIEEARQMFDKMPERDEYTWNTMIVAYASSGRLSDAKQFFLKNPMKNTISWNALISGYSKFGNNEEDEAFALFWEMQFNGRSPTEFTLGSVLKICTSKALLVKGEQIHGYTVKTGFDSDVSIVNGLIAMYANCRRVSEAEFLFGTIENEKKNNVTWTSMLTGYSRNGFASKAIECFRDMKREGQESNQFTFPSVLTACSAVSVSSSRSKIGAQVHCCIVKSGFKSNIFVQSSLIDMYVNSRDFETARRLLNGMEVDDSVSLNSMIVGYVREGFKEEALSLFREMHQKGTKIDDFTIPSILNCFASSSSLSRSKETKIASSVHSLIVKFGYGSYKLVNNALVDMYAKRGIMDSAFKVFDKMPERDVISWTALVTGNTHNGFYEEALRLFREMRFQNVSPDDIVTASVLSASAELTLLEFGQQVHGNWVKSGLGSSLSVDNSLVTMYTKCGSLEDAEVIFRSMENRDLITWTAIIVGYAKNGKAKNALESYDSMIGNGVKPDYVTFIGLLFACSHAGFVEDAKRYFDSMSSVYGIAPGPEHYACMIDLFGRIGDFVKVEELLNRMEVIKPDSTVWKSVLSASRKHGNIENGEKAAKMLMELEPENAVPYVLLSNMYSAFGKQEEAANIRRLMRSRNINKEPGYSWIEEKGLIHRFTSEDRKHSKSVEIYSKIDEMMILIKVAGYVPDMSFALHDLDKEGKESGLAYHSEKLAVAFGLLVIPIGAPIRIIKNLRVCGDCHNAMKYISKVYHRHIILRDSNCFHHFKDGNCSCGDYW